MANEAGQQGGGLNELPRVSHLQRSAKNTTAMIRAFRQFFRNVGRPRQTPASAWLSTVGAASEEWMDPTKFAFSPTLPGCAIDDLVRRIVEEARRKPDLEQLVEVLATEFELPEREPLTAVDRALGGIVRAAAMTPTARPSKETDPVAAIAFDMASEDKGIIDDVFPGWREWSPGEHSDPSCSRGSKNEEPDSRLKRNSD